MIVELLNNRVYRTYLGGKRIDRLLGKSEEVDGHYPEDWIASTVCAFNPGRENIIEGLSRSKTGELLTEIIKHDPISMLGEEMTAKYGETMSILVKLLDSAERLVIQAHPTAEFATQNFHSRFGKTECWYILEAEASACVYLGFKPGITKQLWRECFDKQNIEQMLSLLHKIPVKSGDCLYVDGGVPHAIGGGSLLLELQEPTDFMVVPERKTPSGTILPESKLHGGLGFERMFDCFIYKGYERTELMQKYMAIPEKIDTGIWSVIDERMTDKFTLIVCEPDPAVTLDLHNKYAVAFVAGGYGEIAVGDGNISLYPGTRFFISADEQALKICKTGNTLKVIVCMPE